MPEPSSEAAVVLAKLAVPADASAEIVATLPSPARDRVRSWLLERSARLLTAGLGEGGWAPPELAYTWWPAWPRPRTEAGRWFYVQMFLVATPPSGPSADSRSVSWISRTSARSSSQNGLQRAVLAHLRAGKHWQVRRGWCELDG